MTDTSHRIQSALQGRYRIEHELGAGGMASQRGQRRAAEGSEGSGLPDIFRHRFTAHLTPHSAL